MSILGASFYLYETHDEWNEFSREEKLVFNDTQNKPLHQAAVKTVELGLQELKRYLNFSAQIFKRKDGAWGMVYPQDDGSFKTVGFIGDLFLKKADFAIGNVIIFQTRAQFVDYLPAVGIYQGKCRLQHKKFLYN